MSCQTLNLTNETKDCLAIKQGDYFQKFTILVDGDMTTATPYGRIRDNYTDDNGTILADFSFLPLTYDIGTDKTTITPYLEDEVTILLPYTKFQASEGDTPTTRNALVYELGYVLDTGESISLIYPSFVQVIPRVL